MKKLFHSFTALAFVGLFVNMVFEVRALLGADVGDFSVFERIIPGSALLLLFIAGRKANRLKIPIPIRVKCCFLILVGCVAFNPASTPRYGYGDIHRIDGEPVLTSKGNTRPLSESEYRKRPSYEVETAYGWGILFFAFGTAYSYSLVKSVDRPPLEQAQPA